jgi:parallel beta-helix repeat protein
MAVNSVGNNNAALLEYWKQVAKATETPATTTVPGASDPGAASEPPSYQDTYNTDGFDASGAGGSQELTQQLGQLLDVVKQITDLLTGEGEQGVPELGGGGGGAPQAGGPQQAAGGGAPPAGGPHAAGGPGVVGQKGEAGPPPGAIDAKQFGVVGDGKTDDQAALQKAFDAGKAAGKPVYLGEGTYNHSGTLKLDGTSLVGSGDKTVLNATNPSQSAVTLTGNNPSISNMKTTVNSAPERSSMPEAAAVLVQNANGASVSNMTIQGASSNGVRLDGASNSTVANNMVVGTNADGIALMNGSCDNMIQNNVVSQAGDDSFSDNSYSTDAKQDSGNTFANNVSMDNAYGRGIVLAGSANATVKDNVVSGSKWVGIWGDSDPSSGTMTSSGHSISGNTVINNPNGAAVQYNMSGGGVSGTNTSGSLPDLASVLGWDPGSIPDRTSFNSVYQPGTGSGANNSGGNRS